MKHLKNTKHMKGAAAMSAKECARATSALAPQFERYARLLVRKGVAIKPGQELVLEAPVERADFARIVVRAAYEAGAGHVTLVWHDDAITRLGFENVDISYFENTPAWEVARYNGLAEQGAAFLMLIGSDPAMLKGIDPAKPAARAFAFNTQCDVYRDGRDFGRNAWCIAGVSCAAWAQRVFPSLSEHEATYRLWLAILSTARADGDDPEVDWEVHDATFEQAKRFLNTRAFDALHYVSSNGTDLTIGLNKGHLWDGGSGKLQDGGIYFPNIPTEEVFTSPDRLRADGIVYSALPLAHAGNLIRDFWLRFEGGRVVDFGARKGYDVLKSIIERDENSCRLGECALISKNTPIRQTGLLFYNTLYDENASCHLALGKGFPECLEGGMDMSADELEARGVNQSATHVDFMIGSDDLCIWGVDVNGVSTEIFVNGQWAWE